MLMQEIIGEIKTLVILISNEMLGENTDQNTTQSPSGWLLFLFIKVYYLQILKDNNYTSIEL